MPNTCSSVASKYKSTIEEIIHRTEKLGIEHGFPVCDGQDNPRICKGDACSLPAQRKCKKQLGFVHTHPRFHHVLKHVRQGEWGDFYIPAEVALERSGAMSLMEDVTALPSGQDIRSANRVGQDFECVVSVSKRTLICSAPPKTSETFNQVHDLLMKFYDNGDLLKLKEAAKLTDVLLTEPNMCQIKV